MTEIVLGQNFKPVGGKADIRCFLVNATLDGTKDAFLVFCKKSFGFGSSYYFPRQEAWRVRENEEEPESESMGIYFYQLCHDIAVQLYSRPNKHDVRLCGDLLLNNIDELVAFPPDDGIAEAAQLKRQMEQRELVVKINDKVLVDAR